MSRTLDTSSTRRAALRAGVFLCVWSGLACSDHAPPAADLSEELDTGDEAFIAGSLGVAVGYEQHEYVASGIATDYLPTSLPDTGHWELERHTSAAYRTRVVVRRPTDVASASGTVIIEWLNVSGGLDADPEYANLVEEITRQGHIWVGVSAQLIGIEGGPVLVEIGGPNDIAGKGLKVIDPARYASLIHPGDGYSFDMFTQIARAIRRGRSVLGGVRPRVVIAAGESQSAMALTTYYDGVQPLTHAFDAFYIHSRGAFALPFVEPGMSADLLAGLSASERPLLRDDLAAPAFVLQSEGDVVGLLSSGRVRQPDTDTFRLWEVTGTAHADRHLLGSAADTIDCGVPVNDGPMHLVAKAALRGLDAWVRTGAAPPTAPRLELGMTSGGSLLIMRDTDAIALGGLRTPPIDVPVDVLSGAPMSSSIICLLLGSTTPLSDVRIAELYASRAAYEQLYADASADSIAAGYVLADDQVALLGYSRPLRVNP